MHVSSSNSVSIQKLFKFLTYYSVPKLVMVDGGKNILGSSFTMFPTVFFIYCRLPSCLWCANKAADTLL